MTRRVTALQWYLTTVSVVGLSLLVVAGVILLVAGILGFLAMRFARKVSPPQPSQAIQEAEWTLKTLRGNG